MYYCKIKALNEIAMMNEEINHFYYVESVSMSATVELPREHQKIDGVILWYCRVELQNERSTINFSYTTTTFNWEGVNTSALGASCNVGKRETYLFQKVILAEEIKALVF